MPDYGERAIQQTPTPHVRFPKLLGVTRGVGRHMGRLRRGAGGFSKERQPTITSRRATMVPLSHGAPSPLAMCLLSADPITGLLWEGWEGCIKTEHTKQLLWLPIAAFLMVRKRLFCFGPQSCAWPDGEPVVGRPGPWAWGICAVPQSQGGLFVICLCWCTQCTGDQAYQTKCLSPHQDGQMRPTWQCCDLQRFAAALLKGCGKKIQEQSNIIVHEGFMLLRSCIILYFPDALWWYFK